MKKYLFLLLLVPSICYADPEPHYEDVWVTTTIIKKNESYSLDVPFKVYAQRIYKDGQEITMNLDDSAVGQTVDAWVAYDRSEHGKVISFSGYDGKDQNRYDLYGNLPLYPDVEEKESAHGLIYETKDSIQALDEIAVGVRDPSYDYEVSKEDVILQRSEKVIGEVVGEIRNP